MAALSVLRGRFEYLTPLFHQCSLNNSAWLQDQRPFPNPNESINHGSLHLLPQDELSEPTGEIEAGESVASCLTEVPEDLGFPAESTLWSLRRGQGRFRLL